MKKNDNQVKVVVFDGNIYANRKEEQRNPVEADEFWLLDDESAFLPFAVDFVPPDESYGKFQPLSYCKQQNATRTINDHATKIVFVQIVRTEAFWVQDFLKTYASSCHAGFVAAAMCSGLSWESMIKGSWTNRMVKGMPASIRCPIVAGRDRKGKTLNRKHLESKYLEEKHIDVLVGQIPLGSHQQWKDENEDRSHAQVVLAQSIVSLRDPYQWLVSSVMDKLASEGKKSEQVGDISLPPSVKEITKAVNAKVEADRAANLYHEIYARYLITPSQISWIQKEEAELSIEHRVDLSLRNLMEQNALIVINEDKKESMEKLQYLLDPNGDRTDQQTSAGDDVMSNATMAVNSVLERLKEDDASYKLLAEYLQYEMKIYEAAKDMHARQLAWVRKARSE